MSPRRLNLLLFGLFAGLALLLSAIVFTVWWRMPQGSERRSSGFAWRSARSLATC